MPPLSAIEEAERAGFDLTLIEDSLRLSHEERLLQHERALQFVLAMECAGRGLSGETQSAD